jgi:hypothetical protein
MGNRQYDPRYLGYFECFNRRQFFEAHEVLEALWLPQRQSANGAFYKGLIQLAGAFVHWQKHRPGPALSLLNLARVNLRRYPAHHDGLNVSRVLGFIEGWLRDLPAPAPAGCPPLPATLPRLEVEPAADETNPDNCLT